MEVQVPVADPKTGVAYIPADKIDSTFRSKYNGLAPLTYYRGFNETNMR
jgi:hypothetical protein